MDEYRMSDVFLVQAFQSNISLDIIEHRAIVHRLDSRRMKEQ